MSTFDPDTLTARQEELEAAMGEPGFWDDQQQAARISTEHARVARRLERYERLDSEVGEARELFELDPSLEDELRGQGERELPLELSRRVEIRARACRRATALVTSVRRHSSKSRRRM